jgi:hypothetical protein
MKKGLRFWQVSLSWCLLRLEIFLGQHFWNQKCCITDFTTELKLYIAKNGYQIENALLALVVYI